jgi:hypothetical protein
LRRPGLIWEIKETGKLAFSYHKEQKKEFGTKVLVYITEVAQLSLFSELPPEEHCRHVLKERTLMKHIGFMD